LGLGNCSRPFRASENHECPGNRALPCPDAFAPLVRGRWVRRVIQEISGSESAAPVEEQKANGLIAIARGNAVGEMEPNNI